MTFSFAFGTPGDESKGELGMGLPLLGGEASEPILEQATPAGTKDGLTLWRSKHAVAGWARETPGEDIEGATGRLYGSILKATRGLTLYRIWNSVPRINGEDPSGLENYRAFCRGRSIAFEKSLGEGFERSLPASTAVGTAEGQLTVAFLAGQAPARHFENPAQIPAYRYPAEHGPRSPSFARATVIERGSGRDVFISGTSAIVGHATVAPHDTAGQLESTIENLRLVSLECGLAAGTPRHFKVYLRNPSDREQVARRLGEVVLGGSDRVSYLGADICRSALNVEIEAAIRGAERS